MNKIKKSNSRIIFEVFNILFSLFMVAISVYPILYVLFASVSDSNALLRHGGMPLFKPLEFNMEAYKSAFRNPNIFIGYRNTVFIVFVGTFLSLFLSSVGAYFMSRKNVLWKGIISKFILFTMFFSGGLIPFYLTVKELHLTGTIWSLIIPVSISTYNLIILRTAFASIPESLTESARVDGAGHMTILFRIVLPLSKATLAVIALYYGVTYWNSWFHASIFLTGASDKWPLQLVLQQILIANSTASMTGVVSIGDEQSIGESIKYAVIIIATVPILCIYPFLQRYFESGVMIGAVKE